MRLQENKSSERQEGRVIRSGVLRVPSSSVLLMFLKVILTFMDQDTGLPRLPRCLHLE